MQTAEHTDEAQHRQPRERQHRNLGDPSDQLADDDLPRGQVGGEHVLERAASLFIGDCSGGESGSGQQEQNELLHDKQFDKGAREVGGRIPVGSAVPPRRFAHARRELSSIEQVKKHQLQEQPARVQPAKGVLPTAPAAEQHLQVEDRPDHERFLEQGILLKLHRKAATSRWQAARRRRRFRGAALVAAGPWRSPGQIVKSQTRCRERAVGKKQDEARARECFEAHHRQNPNFSQIQLDMNLQTCDGWM